jgi:hypothetical protein
MKILILLALIGMWTLAGPFIVKADSNNAALTEKEAYILVDNFLGLSAVSSDKSAELQRYKRWADLHASLTQHDQLSAAHMKVYLFMVFIAEEKNKIHSMEEMAKEIIPMFKRQSTVMLQTMKEIPFLVRPTCSRFAAHFGLFGSAQDKQVFISSYEKLITDKLGREKATACMNEMRVNR